jgi:hypothetical protein
MKVRVCLKQGSWVVHELTGEVLGKGDLTRLIDAFWKDCSAVWGCSHFCVERV